MCESSGDPVLGLKNLFEWRKPGVSLWSLWPQESVLAGRGAVGTTRRLSFGSSVWGSVCRCACPRGESCG